MKKFDEEEYRDLGRRYGFEFIGPVPESMLDRTRWRCARGHYFEMRGANVSIGRGCPVCSHRWRRRNADYHTLAKKHGVEWAGGTTPKNTREATAWKLPGGSIVYMPYRSLAVRARRLADTYEHPHAPVARPLDSHLDDVEEALVDLSL